MPKATDTPTTSALYRLGRHPRRPDHHALLRADGTLLNTFAIDATREEIAASLARGGLVLHDDDTVTRAADAAPTRRGILSGLALASAAVLVAAPAIAAEHPDVALLALVAHLEAIHAQSDALDAKTASDLDDDREERANAILNTYWATADRIGAISPRTPDGIRAKARVLRSVTRMLGQDEGHVSFHTNALLCAMLGEG